MENFVVYIERNGWNWFAEMRLLPAILFVLLLANAIIPPVCMLGRMPTLSVMAGIFEIDSDIIVSSL